MIDGLYFWFSWKGVFLKHPNADVTLASEDADDNDDNNCDISPVAMFFLFLHFNPELSQDSIMFIFQMFLKYARAKSLNLTLWKSVKHGWNPLMKL